jgi:Kef-type K+ transport system membrane component KefB
MTPYQNKFIRILLIVFISFLPLFMLKEYSGTFLFGSDKTQAIATAFSLEDDTQSVSSKNAEPNPKDQTESEQHDAGHSDPFSFILIELAVIILVAIIGRWAAIRFDQPAVLGELLIGVILGNVAYWLGSPLSFFIMHLSDAGQIFDRIWLTGGTVLDAAKYIFPASELEPGGMGQRLVQIMTGPGANKFIIMGFSLWLFSNLGVIILLFMVGLESSVKEMLEVGPTATKVAIIGVVCPFILGLMASIWLLPDSGSPVHLFLAATFCATSVGITARVFKDLNKIQTNEAKIILGAAVVDDILALVILAIVVGIVTTGGIKLFEVGRILLFSIIFLGVIIIYGERFIRWVLPYVSVLDRNNSKLLFPLALAFLLAWLSNLIELAAIVGAFAAGLILEDDQFAMHEDTKTTMEETIKPLETIFAPIFFVLMGMQVNLSTFLEKETLWLSLAFIVVAMLGKIVAGIPAGKGTDRTTVGIGMLPRGEVGLIFASIGKGLGVVTDSIFSAVVIMVIVTTLITPLLLKWSLTRNMVR